MKKLKLFLFLITFSISVNSQIIDDYGLRFGAGLSSQFWNIEIGDYIFNSDWKKNKIGFSGQFYIEKVITKSISIRPALGYFQKGYSEELDIPANDPIKIKSNQVRMHDLSLDLAFKIRPSISHNLPYLLIGVRTDFLMKYQGVILVQNNEEYEFDTDIKDKLRDLTGSAILGFGYEFSDFIFLEFEYNPALTKNVSINQTWAKDRYFGLCAGININQIMHKMN